MRLPRKTSPPGASAMTCSLSRSTTAGPGVRRKARPSRSARPPRGVGSPSCSGAIRQLRAYYAFIAERAEWVAKSAVRTAEEVRSRIDAFREIGVDELIFSPSVPDVDQVDLLADAAGFAG